jgi:E3 ubiquitin-protein ligase CBL
MLQPQQMENPDGPHRRELSKLTLVFNHMLADLTAMWPGGVFNSRVTIVKHEARDFWESTWPDAAIVSWDTFTTEFGRVHKFHSAEEMSALRKTVDLLENHHVSRFEFDVFTRLFQPWKQIMNTWNIIVVTHPGCVLHLDASAPLFAPAPNTRPSCLGDGRTPSRARSLALPLSRVGTKRF